MHLSELLSVCCDFGCTKPEQSSLSIDFENVATVLSMCVLIDLAGISNAIDGTNSSNCSTICQLEVEEMTSSR